MNTLVTLLKALNRLIPKDETQVVFSSSPNTLSDNPKALYDYMVREFGGSYRLLWVVPGDKHDFYLKNSPFDVISTRGLKNGLKGMYQLFRSKYIVTSSNDYTGLSSSNQILVNLWHGMPLKGLGFLDNFETQKSYIKKTWNADDFVIATSSLMRNTISACFTLDPRKIYVTGQPRNDKLFQADGKENLSRILQLDLSGYDKIVLYCPTYRVWGDRVEGKPKQQQILDFDDFDEDVFNDFLRKENVLFLLKLHPLEEGYYTSKFKSHTNIKLLISQQLSSQFMDLYDILNSVDVLVTDYSSVYFDFMLLERPTLFTPTDIKEYSKRGFTLEPYDFWAPGPKATNFKDFIRELECCIDDPDYYGTERRMVNDLVNTHKDDKSCQRVYDLVFRN